MLGFIFDIDGCLTLPGHSISILDIPLLDQIHLLAKSGTPVALVTGRSDGWLKKHYRAQNRVNYLDFETYIEFGLVRLHNGQPQVVEEASGLLDLHDELIEKLSQVATDEEIYFEPDKAYNDFPAHGSMWLENKHIQISIASHEKVSHKTVHRLAAQSWSQFRSIRILNHHLGVDVIPKGWSKAKATQHFISHNNLNETDYKWYVFGDNSSDREMCDGLSKVEFIDTKTHASSTVRAHLEQLLDW
jgi:HAD superfamily hydrolase (TIGR01484 family)